jgi:hypothetical protein
MQVFSQSYGNSWINYAQRYYAFKIWTTGVHRIDYSALVSSGIPVNSFSSANIQVFGREKEIPLFIQDGGDNQLNAGDYLLFYGQRNDGWLDTTLYATSADLGNPKYSLYNDTIEYFFTWNNSTTNLRFTIENDVNYSAYSPSNYLFFEKFQSFNSAYNEGEKTSDASSSFYTSGEGWGNSPVNGASGYTWTNWSGTVLDQLYQGLDAPEINYRSVIVGVSNAAYTGTGNHHTKHTIGASNTVIVDSIFSGYKAVHINKKFSPSLLPVSGATNFKIAIANDQGAATDLQSVNYWSFTYPRNPNLGGVNKTTFTVANSVSQSKVRLDLTNFAQSNPLFFVIGDVPRKLNLIPNGVSSTVLIPNSSSGNNQMVIYQELATAELVSSFKAVNATGFFTNYSNIAAYNPNKALLMVYNPLLQSAAVEYASYRSSEPGGGNYNVLLANVNELYQQYGGGIPKHINGIRRFAHHIYDLATDKPVGLFLMGKGIREANIGGITSTGAGTRSNALVYAQSLIPSFGQPSSDALITSNLPGTTKWTPLIPTGRISVSSNAELLNYLNKIRQYDQQQDQLSAYNSPSKDWQKHVLHFTGGTNSSQQFTFQGYMSSLKQIIEGSQFGASVTTTSKVNNDPLDPSVLNALTERIEQGVSLITFFGHAAPTNTGFEINLDEPSNWNNFGKYPIVFTNSCYNGNIFQSGVSKSESFVNAEGSGAIAYMGQLSLGFPSSLYYFSNQLYESFADVNYGKNLGEQLKSTISVLEFPGASLFTETVCTQMALNGDPMIKLNWHTKPEIELLEQNVTFSPQELDLTTDSIEVSIELTNLGKSITDTFSLEVRRNFPSSSIDSIYVFAIPKLDYKYVHQFKVPLQASIGIGLNSFDIKVDLPNLIDEQYDELQNNQLTKTLFIDVDGILPVVPSEFAVVPDDSVTIKASTINPLATFNTYRFELDTTDLFNSPIKRFAIVSGLGGVKEVFPSQWKSAVSGQISPLICEDSIVYFWRVAIEDPNPNWKESSFQYITGRSGWGQDHFFQFKKNGFSGIEYNVNQRKRLFGANLKQLTCDVKSSTAIPIIYDNAYYIDGTQQEYGLCLFTPSLYVAVIDPLTMEPWGTRYFDTIMQNPNNNFGNANDLGGCRNRVEYYFIFRQNIPAQMDNFNAMMAAVPDSHYILVYSPMTTYYNQWSPSVFSTFSTLGSDSISPSRPNLPFAFFCQKGDPNSVVELFAQLNGEDIHLEALLEGSDYLGQETSTLIGPASEWGSLYWKQDALEVPTSDSTILTIQGYNAAGVLQYTLDTLFTSNDSILQLNNLISAQSLPYLKLNARYIDSTTFTPAQIDRWHVLYTPLPEAAIDGSSAYTWLPTEDTIAEGQDVQFAVDVRNIFTLPMDSLLIRYWILDQNQVKHPLPYDRQDSLLVNAVFRDTIVFNTSGYSGLNALWMEVNPYINGSLIVTDQPEQQHFNNVLQIPFYVGTDKTNPILDVTFDGRRILNGDIISPTSEILISLKDENPFLIMDDISDTTRFGIYVTDPDGIQTRIPFVDGSGNTVMQWIPADAQHKRFKIIYPALFEKDGKYTLLVQGSDRSGNLSGDFEYKITFEVIHASMITHLMNYPNPFSTSTKFVFTLTGTEIPDDILIQIMTVSGKVVREITEDELGPIHIGRNITEFAWDGTDEFGDRLANGVYLYRVQSQLNGESIKHLETGADQYFEKNFGKMFLMR